MTIEYCLMPAGLSQANAMSRLGRDSLYSGVHIMRRAWEAEPSGYLGES